MRMMMMVIWLALGGILAGADPLPLPAAPGPVEIHGRLLGQPFWARLTAPDQRYGGKHVLQLVYTPPAPERLGGTHLTDCPYVLLDDQLRVVAWNGRDLLSNAVPDGKSGYKISLELSEGSGDEAHPKPEQRRIPGATGWDLNLAPVLLALGWRANSSAQVRTVDLFGPRFAEPLQVIWTPTSLTIAGENLTPTPDGDGHLQRLTDAQGAEVLVVEGRK